ncbi:POK18 protein, partial [Neodrepanis coruscans]|nr:POK18 protein [Neodrepanis coruscans]
PWKYLGWKIMERTIKPQPTQLQIDIQTLNDLQKLLGSINWIRPYLGLTNAELESL